MKDKCTCKSPHDIFNGVCGKCLMPVAKVKEKIDTLNKNLAIGKAQALRGEGISSKKLKKKIKDKCGCGDIKEKGQSFCKACLEWGMPETKYCTCENPRRNWGLCVHCMLPIKEIPPSICPDCLAKDKLIAKLTKKLKTKR